MFILLRPAVDWLRSVDETTPHSVEKAKSYLILGNFEQKIKSLLANHNFVRLCHQQNSQRCPNLQPVKTPQISVFAFHNCTMISSPTTANKALLLHNTKNLIVITFIRIIIIDNLACNSTQPVITYKLIKYVGESPRKGFDMNANSHCSKSILWFSVRIDGDCFDAMSIELTLAKIIRAGLSHGRSFHLG